MAVTVGAFEAKTHLSELLQRVEAGEQVTITKHGRPVARLVPVGQRPTARDWQAYWGAIDARAVVLPQGRTIKELIDEGRL
jgi:prevent-host-death family protein